MVFFFVLEWVFMWKFLYENKFNCMKWWEVNVIFDKIYIFMYGWIIIRRVF